MAARDAPGTTHTLTVGPVSPFCTGDLGTGYDATAYYAADLHENWLAD